MLQLRNISKQYSGITVLHDVSMDVARGEVHGLVGENGAGKTTLVSILSGSLAPSAGEIAVEGQVRSFAAPHDALRAGIAHVSQEGSLVPYLTGAENILLGAEPRTAGLLISSRRLYAEAQALAKRTFPHRKLELRTPVEELSYADQKVIEILRALRAAAKVLILDEPTASLPADDKERLSSLIRELAGRGITVILISHYLQEILALSDRITVLRDGVQITTLGAEEATEELLVRHMLARNEGRLADKVDATARPQRGGTPPRLEVKGLTGERFAGVDLSVGPGEVVGLVGLVGAGQIEFAEALYAASPRTAGEVLLDGQLLGAKTPREALRSGVCLVPDQRMLKALLAEWTVRENLSLVHLGDVRLGALPLVDGVQERRLGRGVVDRLRIKASSLEQPTQELSGGNKQKVSIGRWLFERTGKDYRVMVFVEPSEGVDVGVKEEIHSLIRGMAESGMSVIVVSSDLLEVAALAHRVGVFKQGRLVTELEGDIDEEALISAMAGGE